MDIISEGVVVLVQRNQCYKTFIPKKGRCVIVLGILRRGSSDQDLAQIIKLITDTFVLLFGVHCIQDLKSVEGCTCRNGIPKSMQTR